MLTCFFIRRKLYDYLEHSLSEIDRIKIEAHLDRCLRCRQKLAQLESIITLAQQQKAPSPNNEFWHDFRIELDRKLNDRLTGPVVTSPKFEYRFKPVFAYALVLVFILVLGGYFYKSHVSIVSASKEDKALAEEVSLLDEFSEVAELDNSEDALIEELSLQYNLSKDLTKPAIILASLIPFRGR